MSGRDDAKVEDPYDNLPVVLTLRETSLLIGYLAGVERGEIARDDLRIVLRFLQAKEASVHPALACPDGQAEEAWEEIETRAYTTWLMFFDDPAEGARDALAVVTAAREHEHLARSLPLRSEREREFGFARRRREAAELYAERRGATVEQIAQAGGTPIDGEPENKS